MNVFISWSGELSKKLGQAFREWLPGVLQVVKPYFSPDDIDKGARWDSEIADALEACATGILCMTPENLEAPWLIFEAGALAKQVGKAHVCPVLFGVEPTDLKGPLAHFQAARFNVDEIRKLVATINGLCGETKLGDPTLDTVFAKWWPDLETQVRTILSTHKGPAPKPARDERDLLEEILSLARASASERGEDEDAKRLTRELNAESVERFIIHWLRDGPLPSQELIRRVENLGVSRFCLAQALDELLDTGRVVSTRRGDRVIYTSIE